MQTLLESLKDATTTQERNVITIQLSTISNAHREFVISLKQQLLTSIRESQGIHGLILAFGALASNADPEVEHEVATILLGLQETLAPTNTSNTAGTVHLILAMGNTGSMYVINHILDYVESSVEEFQQASIRALLKFTHVERVANSLAKVLDTDCDEGTVLLIVNTVVKGHRYSEDRDIEISSEINYHLINSLVSAALRFNNSDLTTLVAAYLYEAVGMEGSALMNELQIRSKRGTSDWDSSSSSEYNLVASLSSRQSDVVNYPQHKAYIHGKTFGISEANLKAAAGVFFGLSNDCENMKGYARAYAECNVLSRKKILADLQILLQKTATTIHGRMFAEIGGNTLVNENLTINGSVQCHTYNTPLARSRYRFFTFTYPVFIYVGTIDFSVNLYVGMNINFDAQACASLSVYNLASGTAGIVPQIFFTVEGSASVTLLVCFVL